MSRIPTFTSNNLKMHIKSIEISLSNHFLGCILYYITIFSTKQGMGDENMSSPHDIQIA